MKHFRKNDDIRVAQVRLIDENGEQVGVVSTEEAKRRAKAVGLDVVEISPNADTPVCKIMDFGAYIYEKKKQEKRQKLAGKVQDLKELKFGIRISDHDFGVRLERAKGFLEKGHPVRVVLQFRGREQAHAGIGIKRLDQMKEALEAYGKQEFSPKEQGRSMVTEFRPHPKKK